VTIKALLDRQALPPDIKGKEFEPPTIGDCLNSITYLANSIESIASALTAADFELAQSGDGLSSWISGSAPVMVQTRAYGSEQKLADREYGTEARVNLLLFDERSAVTEDPSDPARRRALSIRIDREGYGPAGSDSVGASGNVALDVGGLQSGVSPECRQMTTVLSLGDYFLARNRDIPANYYNVRGKFDPQQGDQESFAALVHGLESSLGR